VQSRSIRRLAWIAANDRRDLGGEQLDRAGDFCERQAADVDLC
jgi:hypothetical protein